MANLNLSEFGENTFVSNADYTFVWDSANSISKKVSRNSWLNSGTLTSDAPVTISQTWGTTGTYTAFKVVANETAVANTASNLLELWAGSTPALNFRVSKSGVAQFGSGSSRAVLFDANGGIGINRADTSLTQPVVYLGFNTAGRITVVSGGTIGFSASANDVSGGNATPVTALNSDAANTLALRNGETNQKFHVYATYSNASNYRRCVLGSFDGANFDIQTEGLGTGAAGGALNFGTAGARRMTITTAGNVGIGTTAPTATLHVNGGELDQDTKRVALFQSNDVNIQNNFSVVGITSSDATVNTFQHRLLDLDYTTATASTGTYIRMLRGGNEKAGIALANDEFVITGEAVERLRISAAGNVGIGTTSPTSKLHVAGNSSPSITLDNTLATGASQLLFKNAVVTGDTDGIFLNGSAQSGFGGAGSINIKATTGPIAFHTASVTNALSIAQNGVVTTGRIIVNTLQLAQILNSNDSKYFWEFSTASEIATFARLQTAPIMQFAGTTNLFPAIKRSTVRLQARLADDSGFTNIQGKLTTDTDYTATVVTPTGFLTLYDAQGTAYRVPCVLAP